jgi:hypothetical protein
MAPRLSVNTRRSTSNVRDFGHQSAAQANVNLRGPGEYENAKAMTAITTTPTAAPYPREPRAPGLYHAGRRPPNHFRDRNLCPDRRQNPSTSSGLKTVVFVSVINTTPLARVVTYQVHFPSFDRAARFCNSRRGPYTATMWRKALPQLATPQLEPFVKCAAHGMVYASLPSAFGHTRETAGVTGNWL